VLDVTGQVMTSKAVKDFGEHTAWVQIRTCL
jgi:hypothetical protein